MNRFFHHLDLRSEVEAFDTIHAEIEKGVAFKGTNLWVLVFAIFIASIGLNTNSTAVIIGAMLISPLMGPINGMGYSIATYNFDLFRTSVKNFSFAVGASLVASTLYFIISPVSTAHSELLARTSPTIYDALIALFGGLAGILAISSRQKGNILPGVAIATALMPPLCTAGYGLASGQLSFFFGAIYLFTINTVFIAISSVIMSKVLKFPINSEVEAGRRKQINNALYSVIIITLLPSIYFGHKLVKEERFREMAQKYVKRVNTMEGSYLLKSDIDAPKREIRLVYGGSTLTDRDKDVIEDKKNELELADCDVKITDYTMSNTEQSDNTNNESSVIEDATKTLELRLNSINSALQLSNKQIDSLKNRHIIGKQLLAELRPLFPQVSTCSFSETVIYSSENGAGDKVALVLLSIQANSLKEHDKERIKGWVKSRLPQLGTVMVHFEELKNVKDKHTVASR